MDRLFEQAGRICHVRVAGLLQNGKRILVQRPTRSPEYALPGGHLQFGETTEEALVREFREEMQVTVRCRRLLWTEECFWNSGGRDAHAISFYYQVELCAGSAIPEGFTPQKDNAGVLFGWLSVGELEKVRICPTFLKQELACPSRFPKHFVRRD